MSEGQKSRGKSMKSNKLTTKHKIIEQCMNTFETKCISYSILDGSLRGNIITL